MINCKSFQPAIERSHHRCRLLGIDENQIESRRILEGLELQNKLNLNRDLILTAKPYIEQLSNFVKGSRFFALLTDGAGCILNAFGDEEILADAFGMRMIPGAYMNEENMGTNAMAMVIKEKEPIQMSGQEHFVRAYHKWTCSAAPIKDIYDNVIGILDLTGYTPNVHLHTLGMVIAASNAIEEMLKVKQYARHSFINQRAIWDTIPVGMILSDANGKILSVNKMASEMFGYIDYELKRIKLSELIENWEQIKRTVYSGKSFYGSEEAILYTNNGLCKVDLGAHPAYNYDEDSMEIILILQEGNRRGKKLPGKPAEGRAIYTFDKIIGVNEDFKNIIQYAKKISASKSTILIAGESGTGKELFAQSIHNFSRRAEEAFVAINCGAIPKELIESELFGYEEGSFTGARRGGNIGKFEMANGGTIFLDEIGDMPLDMQTKLLRVIQEGVITRIGSAASTYVDVRIIAATNKVLRKEVEKGNFRMDLYYRLNVLPLNLPALRERRDDILPLVEYFMKNLSMKLNKKEVVIPREYLQQLIDYNWPGNIRELENMIELIINTERFPILQDIQINTDIKSEENWFISGESGGLKLEEVEKTHLQKVLNLYKGNVTQAAKALGIMRNTLYNKIDKFNLR